MASRPSVRHSCDDKRAKWRGGRPCTALGCGGPKGHHPPRVNIQIGAVAVRTQQLGPRPTESEKLDKYLTADVSLKWQAQKSIFVFSPARRKAKA